MSQQVGLYRSNDQRLLFGVCGGIAERFQISPLWVRLAFVVLAFAGGPGILAYLVCMLVIPRRPVAALTGQRPAMSAAATGSLHAPSEHPGLAPAEVRGVFQPNSLARR